jgi:MFS family permease
MAHAREQVWQPLAFVVLMAATGTAVGMVQLALPLFALDLGAGPAEIGLIRGASGVGLMLAVVPAGFFVDRFGARATFHAGNAGTIIATAALLLADRSGLLVVLMLAEGLFRALRFTALNAAFYQALPRIGHGKVGWIRGALSIGLAFAGPLAGAALLGWGPSRTVFAVAVAAMLLPAALFGLIDSEAPGVPPVQGLFATVATHLRGFAALVRRPDVPGSLAMEMLVAGTFTAFATFITVMAVGEFHLGPATASLLLAVEGGAYIVTVFTLGPLVQRLPHRTGALLSLALSTAALAGLSLVRSAEGLAALSLALGGGLGLLNLGSATCAGRLPGEKGKVAGLFAAAVGLGAAGGPLLAGLVAERFGAHAVFIAFVPLFAAVAAGIAAPLFAPDNHPVSRPTEDL